MILLPSYISFLFQFLLKCYYNIIDGLLEKGREKAKGQKGKNNEFVYLLARVPKYSPKYSPYDLKIVPHEDILNVNEYFTLTLNGVTHFRKGLGSNEFFSFPLFCSLLFFFSLLFFTLFYSILFYFFIICCINIY